MQAAAAPLAAEREYLKLHRRDPLDALVASVNARMDGRLTDRQEIEERENFVAPAMTLFRLANAAGSPVTAHVETGLLTPAVRAKLYDFIRAVEDAERDAARAAAP